MFKNQKGFRHDETTDLKMLKTSIKQWNRLYENAGDTYICGEYKKQDIQEIKDYLTKDFIKKYNIKVIHVDIPKQFSHIKTARLNFQMLAAYNQLKNDFVFCANDIFPIKRIGDDYINKEFKIKHQDYTKLDRENAFWWLKNYISMLEHFNEKYNTDFKQVYNGHQFYSINKDFIDFFTSDEFFVFNCDRNAVLTHYLKMKGEDIFIPDYIGETFARNQWIWDKKKLKQYKGVNITLPNHPKSKSLMSKILLK